MTNLLRLTTVLVLALMVMPGKAQRPGPKLPSADKAYKLYNTSAKVYLLVNEEKVQAKSSAGEEGEWKFVPMPNKTYRIYNVKTKKYLTAPSSNPETTALTMIEKPTVYSEWNVRLGTGMNSRYLFISNAKNNLYITDSGRDDIRILHRKYNGGSGKMFNWRLVIK